MMRRCKNTPTSLAHVSLVRLAKLHSDCLVFTLNADFRRYRGHRDEAPADLARVAGISRHFLRNA